MSRTDPVRVTYSNGTEEMGLWLDDEHIEVGGMALHIRPREELKLDGETYYVYGTQKTLKNNHGIPGVGGAEATVKIRVKRVKP